MRNLLGGGRGNNKSQGGRGQPFVFVANAESNSDNNDGAWVLDSGASHHITNDVSSLSNVNTFSSSNRVIIENGDMLPISHIGISILFTSDNNSLVLRTVLHAPYF